jgi:hypothetical protein
MIWITETKPRRLRKFWKPQQMCVQRTREKVLLEWQCKQQNASHNNKENGIKHTYLIVCNLLYEFHVRWYLQDVKLIIRHNTCFAWCNGQQEPLVEPHGCWSIRLCSKPSMEILLAQEEPHSKVKFSTNGTGSIEVLQRHHHDQKRKNTIEFLG